MNIATRFIDRANELNLYSILETTAPGDSLPQGFLAVTDGDDWPNWSANAAILADCLDGGANEIGEPWRFSSKTETIFLSVQIQDERQWLQTVGRAAAVRDLYVRTKNGCHRFDNYDVDHSDEEEIHVAT